MAEPQGTVFGDKAVEQIAKTVREVSRRMMNEQPHRARWQHQQGRLGVKHGIVTEHLGCGFYTVERAEWTGGIADAGYGLGSDGDGVDDCNICYDIVNEGTSSCAITLTYPPSQLTGTGEYVTARDCASALINLVTPSDCLMINMGDEDADSGEPIWQIIQGMMTHIVKYEEEWDCCEPDGPETLISKTPNILIGRTCATISCGECPA